jgi:hypothetical protein
MPGFFVYLNPKFSMQKQSMRVVVRGCPGMGTRWFSKVLPCLFSGIQITAIVQSGKHDGCHRYSETDTEVPLKLLHPKCAPHDCMHAVISRHPLELKHGRPGANLVWEAYYGAWSRLNAPNVRFFRYEDLVSRGCTAVKADRKLVSQYFDRVHRCIPMRDTRAWAFWNYTNDSCVA